MDQSTAKGMDPHRFATAMIRAIEKEKEEVYIGGTKEILAVYLKRFLPGLFSRIVRSARVR
jgi:short-subunit dehydrogenase